MPTMCVYTYTSSIVIIYYIYNCIYTAYEICIYIYICVYVYIYIHVYIDYAFAITSTYPVLFGFRAFAGVSCCSCRGCQLTIQRPETDDATKCQAQGFHGDVSLSIHVYIYICLYNPVYTLDGTVAYAS